MLTCSDRIDIQCKYYHQILIQYAQHYVIVVLQETKSSWIANLEQFRSGGSVTIGHTKLLDYSP